MIQVCIDVGIYVYICVDIKNDNTKLLLQLKEEIETKEAALTNVNKEQAVIVREKEDLATEVERGMNFKANMESSIKCLR